MPRYRMRTLLVFVLIVSLPLTWFVLHRRSAERQTRVIEGITKLGGHVYYEFQTNAFGSQDSKQQSGMPKWLLTMLGPDFFHDVHIVELKESSAAGIDLKLLAELPEVRWLSLPSAISDDDLAPMMMLPHLESIDFSLTQVTNVGLKQVASGRQLRWLDLVGSQVTGAGLENVQGNGSLFLVISPQQLDERGVYAVDQIDGLNVLWIEGDGPLMAPLGRLDDLKLLAIEGLTDIEFQQEQPIGIEGLIVRCLGPDALDSVVCQLPKMPRLTHLEYDVVGTSDRLKPLSRFMMTGEHLDAIAAKTSLESLILDDILRVPAGKVDTLDKLINLERLVIINANFSEDTIKRFSQMKSLEFLRLYGPGLNDQSLEPLTQFPKLKRVNINSPGITPAAKLNLKKALPECIVR